jgi:hypothetical protein
VGAESYVGSKLGGLSDGNGALDGPRESCRGLYTAQKREKRKMEPVADEESARSRCSRSSLHEGNLQRRPARVYYTP